MWEGEWYMKCRHQGWHCSEAEPRFSDPRDRHPMSCLNRKDLAEYRKWCRLASKWRRLKRECKALLDAMRVVGRLYETKVQTKSDSGYSFNKPFYIYLGETKIPIKKFLDDQEFEDIMFGEEDADAKD